MNNFTTAIGGLGIIRDSDNVFLLGKMPSLADSMQKELERCFLRGYNYRCPFDFLSEFSQWFEWQRRVHFEKHSTGRIITDMLSDFKRIKDHKIEPKIEFRVRSDFGVNVTRTFATIHNFTT